MSRSHNQKSFIKVKSILYGLVVSLILLLIGTLILGGIVTVTNVANQLTNKMLFILNYVVIFIGGIVSAASAKNNGWVNGGLVGLIYMLVIILLGGLWSPITFSINLVIRVLIGFIVSALGGMIGVNII